MLPLYGLEVRQMRNALEMTRVDAERELGKSVLVMPMGSLEQHGPHLPLGTDCYIAEALAIRVCEAVQDAILLPLLPFGYSWVWKDIPLTVSLKEKTVEEIVKEVALSVYRFNPKALVIINGHLANDSALKYAARDLADEISLKFFYFSLPEISKFRMDSKPSELTVHAEEIETSLMLAIKPELVNMALAKPEYPEKPRSYGVTALSLGKLSRSGVFGDPSVATREKGEQYLELMTKFIISVLQAEKII